MSRSASRASGRRGRRAIVVLVTCPTLASAKRIAVRVVELRLAACVNLLPGVQSWFRWQGRIERAREALLLIKTTAESFEPLRQTVLQAHPYDVPEIIALPVTAGHAPYVAWIAESVARRLLS